MEPGAGREVAPRNLNWPNALTVLRLAAVPVFVVLFLRGDLTAALAVFVGALLSDGLDGLLARVLKQFTALGARLDPIADKALGLSALLVLTGTDRLPRWLLWLALARDAAIFTAIWLLDRTRHGYAMRPTRYGKYTTAFLGVTIVTALAQAATGEPHLWRAMVALTFVTAACMIVSWIEYFAIFVRLMRKAPAGGA